MAKAIVEHAKRFNQDEENPVWPEAHDFESITGHGVKAVVRNKEVLVGNKSLMVNHDVPISLDAEEVLAETEGLAQTGILVSIGRELVAIVAVSDPLKPGAREVISYLKSMKIKSIVVTGDNWGTANAIAKEVGIDTVIAEAKPQDKAEKVKEIQVYNIMTSNPSYAFLIPRASLYFGLILLSRIMFTYFFRIRPQVCPLFRNRPHLT